MKRGQGSANTGKNGLVNRLGPAAALLGAVLVGAGLPAPLLAAIDPMDGQRPRSAPKFLSVAQSVTPQPAPGQAPAQDAVVPPVRREAPPKPAAPTPSAAPAAPTPAAQPAQAVAKPADTTAQSGAEQRPPEFSGVFGTIQEWLARANREYQGVVVKELSLPPPSASGQDAIAEKLKQQQAEDAQKAAAAKRAEDEARQAAEAKAAAAAKAAEAKKLEDDRKRAEETKRLADEAKKKADEVLKAEPTAPPKPDDAAAAQQKAREAEQREAQRLADEAKRQEQVRQEQARKAEEQRRLAAERAAKAEADRTAAERQRAIEAAAPRQTSRTVILRPEPITRPADPGSRFRPELANRRTTDTAGDDDAAQPHRVVHRKIRVYREDSYRGLGGPVAHGTAVKRWVWRADGRQCAGAGQRVTPPARYTIKRGDSLWRISERHYHQGRLYPKIYAANRASIADPDLIYPCQRVMVPRKR